MDDYQQQYTRDYQPDDGVSNTKLSLFQQFSDRLLQAGFESATDSNSSTSGVDEVQTHDSTALQMGPVNEPILREWDVNENSTYYDSFITAPSDKVLQQMWMSFAVILFFIAIFTLSVFLAIVFTKSTRKSPFNMYLIYLMIPDFVMSFFCAISCLHSYILHGYPTNVSWPCYTQSYYLVFAITGNSWMNALVARQLLILLRCSQAFRKYEPPSHWQVTQQALAVYALSLFVGFLGVVQSFHVSWDEWWPHWTRLNHGIFCFPQPHDHVSVAFYYLVFIPLLFVCPLIYVTYVAITVWRHNLLPPPGRRRTLSVYFFRLAVAFVIMWVPCVAVVSVAGPWVNIWVYWVGAIWGHLQGGVSSFLSLFKPDIWKAYKNFYTRRVLHWCIRDNNDLDDGTSSSFFTARFSVRGSMLWRASFSRSRTRSSMEQTIEQITADLARWEAQETSDMSLSSPGTRTNSVILEKIVEKGESDARDEEEGLPPRHGLVVAKNVSSSNYSSERFNMSDLSLNREGIVKKQEAEVGNASDRLIMPDLPPAIEGWDGEDGGKDRLKMPDSSLDVEEPDDKASDEEDQLKLSDLTLDVEETLEETNHEGEESYHGSTVDADGSDHCGGVER